MMLSTMLRSVHNNSMKGETFLNFKGIEAEVYFQIPVMKYLGFFIDAEADVNKELRERIYEAGQDDFRLAELRPYHYSRPSCHG